MRTVTCESCKFQIAESDKSWDTASQYNICPNCKRALNYFTHPDNIVKTKRFNPSLRPSRNTFITFAFAGPLIGAFPFLLMSLGAGQGAFVIIIFAYLVGVLPASLAGLIFNSIMNNPSQSKHYQGLLYGAMSGLIGVLPLALIFGTMQSFVATSAFCFLGLLSGGVCGHISKP